MMRRLTTRWSGPGIRREFQETFFSAVIEEAGEGEIPGRSARSR